MAAVTSALKSGAKALAEPLVCVGLKAVLGVPAGGLVAWVKSRFEDPSQALPLAIAAANARAWQAVGLALAGDSLLGRITSLFRDGDLKAVQAQIRAFVTDADTGLDGQPAGLRARACDELNRLQRAGRLGAEVRLESLDLTRFASTATVADDAHRAIRHIADNLAAECPHLAQVLILSPPGGGTPLLAAAFAFFLRRQIATNAELARELTHDQLGLLTQKQQAGFANLETALADKWDSLETTLGGWFATTDATLDAVRADLKKLLDANQAATKPESPLRVSVTGAEELDRLKKVRDRLRGLPPELIDAKLFAALGDGEAAAGGFEQAQTLHGAAATAAKESADAAGEADAAYKQFKDACELKAWDAALAALNRAVALDDKRFRPVPKHYTVDGILGAGAFGVVLKCRDRTETDDDGNHVVVAVKTFRAADLDRPLEDIFAEASLLKKLTHPNVIGIHERGFADPDGQQRPFLAMEYFPGVTLEDHLDTHGKLSLADFLAVFGGVAAALHAAHTARRPIIHRDVKPANVMLMRVDGGWVVKVIDFGLAVKSAMRQASRELSRRVSQAKRSTHDRSVTGTFKYAAPEQLGERAYPVGPWSDVYAFGKTALEALLGTVQPTPKHWKQLPAAWTDLLARCVDEDFDVKNPEDGRYHGFAPVMKRLNALVVGESEKTVPVTSNTFALSATKPALLMADAPPLAAGQGHPNTTEQATEKVRVYILAKELKLDSKELLAFCQELGYAGIMNQLSGLETDQVTALKKRAKDGPGKPAARPTPAAPVPTVGGPTKSLDTRVRTLPPAKPQAPAPNEQLTPPVETALIISERQRTKATPVQKAGDKQEITLPGGVKMAFAWCPAGTFLMGSPASEKNRESNEQQHEVRLTRGFWMGIHPVTQAQYQSVMGSNPSHFNGDTLPVESVSWKDAVQFGATLKQETGMDLRLPTEAEWEYAARGGTATPFYWGGELNGTQANCDGTHPYGSGTKGPYLQKTTPVGSYAVKFPHPWGMTDVLGNVWEWCADFFDLGYYAKSPKEDPTGPDNGLIRVYRGGSWFYDAKYCRAAFRGRYTPSFRFNNLGFRLATGPSSL